MFSATWPDSIQTLAADYLNNFIQIYIGSTDLTANANIEQNVIVCQNEEKKKLLLDVLEKEKQANGNVMPKTLIFVERKRNAEYLQSFLNNHDLGAIAVHGDKTQRMRTIALEQFRSDRRNILVATDVAARGLDVSNIKLVINYDMANTIEDHVHRIGRTGRANSQGKAISFFTYEDSSLAAKLTEFMKKSNQEIDPELLKMNNSTFFKKDFRFNKPTFANNKFNKKFGYKSRNSFQKNPRKFYQHYENLTSRDF